MVRIDDDGFIWQNIIMYTLYVGAPNATHKIDIQTLAKIKSMTSKYFESYTYVKARGVFQDTEEDMVMIAIANADESEVYKLGEELREFLRQDGIGVEHNGVYEKMIT